MASTNDPVAKTGLFDNGYALVVGIANYSKVRKLPKTVLKDAQDISILLRNPEQCGYPADQVKHLVDDMGTANEIRNGLQWLAEQTSKDDTAVFFFSGHGGRIESGSATDNYLISYDTDPDDLKNTSIDGQELTTLLQDIKAGRLLVLFDCCHAGGLGEAKKNGLFALPNLKTGLDERLYERLGQGNGRVIIASSRSDEYSWMLSGMENSLFTYYLLEALRGFAPVRGDGLIRLFDLFDYVSHKVNERHPAQHPILKAELENNFPIALYVGGKVADLYPAEGRFHQTAIQNFLNLSLNPAEEKVLSQMFEGYERLVLKAEFEGGFSGGRVLMLRPITSRGAELPTVVKLGPEKIIQQEWDAFARFVRQKVPKVAKIEGNPIYSSEDRWGGIRYPLAGDGRFYTESLGRFCQHATAEDVVYILAKRLFPSISAMWQDNQVVPELFLGDTFDPILPVNLFVRLASTVSQAIELTPQSVRHQLVQAGAEVTLSDFVVSEVDEAAGELTLDLPSTTNELPNAYRLRVTVVADAGQYKEGVPLPHPIAGVVQATRYTVLEEQIEQAFNGAVDGMADTLTLPEIGSLPNPLLALPDILKQTNDLRVGPIHGDLNLENILVEYDQKSRDVHLIDFASARYDCVLHDLLRLETGFWLYLVPAELAQNGRSLSDLNHLVVALHTEGGSPVPGLEKPLRILTAVRQMAQHLLARPYSWDEYYQGLIVYLLGALKFRNLNDLPTTPLPKQVAIVTAAFIQQLQKELPMPTAPSPSSPSPSSKPPVPKSELLRQIRFRLRKLEVFESDRDLRTVFKNNSELQPWADRLPEANARQSRADMTVAFLLDRYSAENQNALVIFLRVLVREYDVGEHLHSELIGFADRLQLIL